MSLSSPGTPCLPLRCVTDRIDATTGGELWNVELADMELAYAFTLSPLAIKDKVLVGSTGGDQGIRGFVAALDAETGEEVWRFYTSQFECDMLH